MIRAHIRWRSWAGTALAVGIVLLSGLINNTRRGLSLDEALTLEVSSPGRPAVEADHGRKVPPLHRVLLREWHKVRPTIPFARLLSTLAAAGFVVFVTRAGSRLRPRDPGLALGLLGALCPFVLWAASEVRASALALLLAASATLAFLSLLDCAREAVGRSVTLYVVCAGLGALTTYGFALLVVAHLTVGLLSGRPRGRWVVAGGILGGLWATSTPLFPQMSRLPWDRESMDLAPSPAEGLGIATILLLLLVSAGMLVVVRPAGRLALTAPEIVAAATAVLPSFLPALQWANDGRADPEHLAVAIPGLLIFVWSLGARVARMRASWMHALVAATGAAAASAQCLSTPTQDWRAAAEYVQKGARPREPMLFFPPEGVLPFRVYFTGGPPLRGIASDRGAAPPLQVLGSRASARAPIESQLRTFLRPGAKFWLVEAQVRHPLNDGFLEGFVRERLDLIEEGRLPGLRVRRFSAPPTLDCRPPCAAAWTEASSRETASLLLEGSRGGIAAAGFEVAWPLECTAPTLCPSDLRTQGGSISRAGIRVREVLAARYEQGGTTRLAPTWLVPVAERGSGTRRRSFWTAVSIPSHTRAGVYLGTIEVRCSGSPPLVVPVRMTVRPLDLPPSRVEFAMLYTHEFSGLERFEPDVEPGRRFPEGDGERFSTGGTPWSRTSPSTA